MVTGQMVAHMGAVGCPHSRTPPPAAAHLYTECTPSHPCRNKKRKYLLSFTERDKSFSPVRQAELLRGEAEERWHMAGQVEDLRAAIAAQ